MNDLYRSTARALNDLGALYHEARDYESASARYSESVRVRIEGLRDMNRGKPAEQELQAAQQHLAALAEEEQRLSEHPRRIEDDGKAGAALDLYSMAAGADESIPMCTDPTFLRDDVMDSCADDDADLDDADEDDESFRAAKEKRAAAITLQNLGRLHRAAASASTAAPGTASGHSSKALQFFQMALNAAPLDLDADPKLTASILDDTGLVYYELGRLDEAHECFVRAADQYRVALDETSFSPFVSFSRRSCTSVIRGIADVYSHQGRVQFAWGQYDNAMQCARSALRLRAKAGSYDDMAVASTHFNIGLIHYAADRPEEAIEHCQWFFNRGVERLGIGNNAVLKAAHVLGTIQRESGLLADAEETLAACLEFRKASDDCDEDEIADTLFQIGRVQQDVGNHVMAINSFREALIISAQKSEDSDDEDSDMEDDEEDELQKRMAVLCCLAQSHHALGDLPRVLLTYERVLNTIRSRREKGKYVNVEMAARILITVAKIQMRRGKMKDAKDYFKEAEGLLPCGNQNELLSYGEIVPTFSVPGGADESLRAASAA
mmetsp:Transcript_17499/g.24134  ORF Transcript_17499/g.24134 Transcript_17499/m.24134 type:complete len:552 (-) Transcript_17499:54-1709(-)